MIRQFELVDRLKAYDPNIDEDLLNRAYVFSMKAHGTQIRASGDPYFSHPLEVAGILTDLKLDCLSIVTALLHDTVEDTVATLTEIEDLFGPEVARLVDGVTKLSKLELQSEQTKQAENFRKLVLATSSDLRVLLVKLADRLHNMRTLHYIESDEKRRRIALETMEIYAPLAERMGMHKIKDELEDLSFAVLNPEGRDSIRTRLKFLYESSDNMVTQIVDELSNVMRTYSLNAVVNGREKAPYSIWRKMQTKNITFEQLCDIIAFRIIVDDIGDCYQALGLIHGSYPVIPGRFKDYISTPKPNGYRSLHTAVLGPLNQRIELQIRTQEMHQIADLGVAAHWQYKQGKNHDGKQYAWLRSLLDILEHASEPQEFLEHTKLEMFQDQVFCFTPMGDLISLPNGATPIDFAYEVHSEVGDHTIGCKINGRQMPLRTVLHNGDQVEIITAKNQTPSPTWERFVVTGKARARIRRYIRNKHREEFAELGKNLLTKGFHKYNLEFTDTHLQQAARHFHFKHIDDFYAAIGEGTHAVRDIIDVCYPDRTSPVESPEAPFKTVERKVKKTASPLSIKGLIPGMAVHFAGCCHPLPGDKIIGNIITGKGVTIHTQDCEIIKHFDEPERLIDLAWQSEFEEQNVHIGRLKVTFVNKQGALATLTTAISKQGGNLANIKVAHRTVDFWDVLVDIDVKDVDHLKQIIASLRALPIVNDVTRY